MIMNWWTHAGWSGYGAHLLCLMRLSRKLWYDVLQRYIKIQGLEKHHGQQ